MFKMLTLASAAVVFSAAAAFADNPNVPTWSPYTLVPAGASAQPAAPVHLSPTMAETRAASVDIVPNANVPSWSPYALAPEGR